MQPRLATWVWVQAYMQRLSFEGVGCYVVAKGDPTAGAVMVKCADRVGGAVLFQRSYDLLTDTRVWSPLMEGAEPEVDALMQRERARDPDLWLIEVEGARGRDLLSEAGFG